MHCQCCYELNTTLLVNPLKCKLAVITRHHLYVYLVCHQTNLEFLSKPVRQHNTEIQISYLHKMLFTTY